MPDIIQAVAPSTFHNIDGAMKENPQKNNTTHPIVCLCFSLLFGSCQVKSCSIPSSWVRQLIRNQFHHFKTQAFIGRVYLQTKLRTLNCLVLRQLNMPEALVWTLSKLTWYEIRPQPPPLQCQRHTATLCWDKTFFGVSHFGKRCLSSARGREMVISINSTKISPLLNIALIVRVKQGWISDMMFAALVNRQK